MPIDFLDFNKAQISYHFAVNVPKPGNPKSRFVQKSGFHTLFQTFQGSEFLNEKISQMECENANLKQAVTRTNEENLNLTQKLANLNKESQQTANNLTLAEQVCFKLWRLNQLRSKF